MGNEGCCGSLVLVPGFRDVVVEQNLLTVASASVGRERTGKTRPATPSAVLRAEVSSLAE